MLIPVGYAQSNLRFTGSAVPSGAEVTCGHSLATFAGGPEDAAEAIGDAWATTVLDYQAEALELSSTLIKYGPNATGVSVEVANGTNGGNVGAVVTPNTSVLVKKTTSMGGRQGQGRFYIPGYTENNIDGSGNISPADIVALQAALNAYYAALVAAELPPVLLSAVGSPSPTPRLVESFQVQATVATQRRRLRR